MIEFPASTRLVPPRRIPKEKICSRQTKNVAKLKSIFTQEVDKIVWTNKLYSKSLNMPESKDIKEIEVFELALKMRNVNPSIYQAIDEAVAPHSVLYLITTLDHFEAVFGYQAPGEKARRYFRKAWIDCNSAELELRGSTLDEVYIGILRQLGAEETSGGEMTGERSVKAWQERDFRRSQLEQKIERLTKRKQKELQINRRFEMALEIKRLEEEIRSLS